MGATRSIALEVRKEYTDTLNKVLAHFPNKNVISLCQDMEDFKQLANILIGIDTILYTGHFYHTKRHQEILETFTQSNSSCIILESVIPNTNDPKDIQYHYEDSRDPLNVFDNNASESLVGLVSMNHTIKMLNDLGWTVTKTQTNQYYTPKRFVLTAIR
jgi:hypothetical protein